MFRKMFGKPHFPSPRRSNASRLLRFEHCEDRRLLDAKTDIVFLVDESRSESPVPVQEWLTTLISGDVNRDGDNNDVNDTLSLAQKLVNLGINDVRYGLVGFGESLDNPAQTVRYSHSQLFDFTTGDPDSLFGDPTAPQSGPDDPLVNTGALNTIFDDNTAELGGSEDGWDALEHAIAEYTIRDGAVPVFVLVQNDEGRIDLNAALTRPGVLAALESKNATLHVLVPGLATRDSEGFAISHAHLFNVSGAGANERILGVEADATGGPVDMRHHYDGINTVTHVATSGQFDDTAGSLDFIDGETGSIVFPSGLVGGETEFAYVPLARNKGNICAVTVKSSANPVRDVTMSFDLAA